MIDDTVLIRFCSILGVFDQSVTTFQAASERENVGISLKLDLIRSFDRVLGVRILPKRLIHYFSIVCFRNPIRAYWLHRIGYLLNPWA